MSASPKTHGRAQRLRRALTPPEVRLWVRLRGRPRGLKFRRQQPFGHFILDFFCFAALLAIEVDGAGHADPHQRRHDHERDAYLRANGVRVLRLSASEVMADADAAATQVLDLAEALTAGLGGSVPPRR